MYMHSIPWSFRLREMASRSQRQHDALCRQASGEQVLYLASLRLYSLIEQPEEKDEIVKEGLALLTALETDIVSLKRDDSCGETPFEAVQSISNENLEWLKWAAKAFDYRFSFKKDKKIRCACCGYPAVVTKDGDLSEKPCPVCNAKHCWS